MVMHHLKVREYRRPAQLSPFLGLKAPSETTSGVRPGLVRG